MIEENWHVEADWLIGRGGRLEKAERRCESWIGCGVGEDLKTCKD
jgi:hypothetical protein